MKATIYTLLAASILAISSCQSDDITNSIVAKARQDIPLSRTEELISDKTQEFSLNLIKETLKSEDVKGKNLFFSPLGVSAVLNMLGNGAGGNTATEIYSALSPEGCTAEDLNGFYSKLNTWLPDLDNTTTVAEAYSLWVNNQFSVKSSYTNLLKSTLNSDVFVKDFSNLQSTQDLYAWCSEKTNGCIKKLDVELSKLQMLAVNALYFKGMWANKFEESQTQEADFYGTKGTTKVQMMRNNNISVKYIKSDGLTAIDLPYGNNAYSMMLVLPDEHVEMTQMGVELMESKWKELTDFHISVSADLRLPKFDLSDAISFIDILKALDIKDAFCGDANFSKMTTNENAFISLFKQETCLSVGEAGTEAAAVTYAGIYLTANPGGEVGSPLEITFNRPFFFFIREQSTGLILFMGKVENL